MDEFKLNPLGQIVWEDRYGLKDENGNLIEKNILETFRRVAKAMASKEKDSKLWEERFYDIMANKYFCPAGRILAHAGTPHSQLLNCFVLPFEDDSLEEIMETAKNMAITQKFSGGTGFNYSNLRPSGAHIKGVNGRSCGVLGFMNMMSTVSEVIEQGGCLTEDSLINTEKGMVYFNELVKESAEGWHEHNLVVKSKDGDNLSKRYFINGLANTIKIETEYGTILNGTLNHKLYVFTKSGFAWKEFKDIKKGDYLIHKLNQFQGTEQELNTNITAEIHHNCIIPEKFPKVIDEEFAFFLGYMGGNGFATAKEDNYRLGVSIPDKSYLNSFVESMFKDLFGSNISVLHMKKDNDLSSTYCISNKLVKSFLANNGLLKCKSLDTSIPYKIRCSPINVVGSYLSGLFEADGALSHGYPQISTSSYKLAKEIQILLFGLGIPARMFKAKRTLCFSKNDLYIVRVVSFKGLENWNKTIKHHPDSRFSVCSTFKPDLSKEKNYILPYSEYWLSRLSVKTKELKNKSREIKSLIRHVGRYLRGDRNFSLSSYSEVLKEHPFAKDFLPPVNDLFFDKVETLVEDKKNTFDIEVNEAHSYIANSLVSHNSRRGANLGLLEISHPDIWEYIGYKTEHNWDHLREFIDVKDEEKWTAFKFENLYKLQMYNISVGITDEFLDAVKKDAYWPLLWKDKEWELYTVRFKKSVGNELFKALDLEVVADCDKTAFWKVKKKIPFPGAKDVFEVVSKRKIKASEIWNKICYNAWADGCPGLINLSTARKYHNLEYVHPVLSTNPCGEQPIAKNSSCNLSSIVLPSFYNKDTNSIDYPKLKAVVHTAIRFSDNVIDNCVFPIPEIKKVALEERRIGLGTMGVHDLLIKMKLGYDSPEGRDVINELLRTIRDEAYKASIKIAKEKGAFPLFDKEKFTGGAFIKTLPPTIRKSIFTNGIRNGTLTSQAPTGSTGTMYNCSTGCEPWFALSFQRNTRLGSYEDGCPDFIQWKKENPDRPKPSYFKTSQEISSEDHIKMMALFSKYICSAVSKTVNLPNSATVEDVKKAFEFAMEQGAKGITIFRDGSKEGVLVNKDKEKIIEEAKECVQELQGIEKATTEDSRAFPIQRGNLADGSTYRIPLQHHNLYVTVNRNDDGKLVEVFAVAGKSKRAKDVKHSGVENSWAEALGRLASLCLRAGVDPCSIISNLKNITSDKPVFGTIGRNENSELIPSPPHAIARVMEEELIRDRSKEGACNQKPEKIETRNKFCTECGSSEITLKGPNCYECHSCGYSGCGS